MSSPVDDAPPTRCARPLKGATPADRPAKGRIRQVQEATILEAAERVFARSGLAGSTLQAIADAAGCPKSTLLYYFGNKEALHRAVLEHILALWLEGMEVIEPDADPRTALTQYLRHKMRLSAERPHASRVFANELLHGAPQLLDTLRVDLRALVLRKAAVIEHWIAQGHLAPVDPLHLFISLWALTQTYADFEVQVAAVLGSPLPLPASEQARATQHVESFVLRACGLITCA